jgi:NodT family efflux transporter outer membrane factor (OMF) lipoprotein
MPAAVRVLGGWGIAALLAACAAGPDYHRAAADVPPAWQPTELWHEAVPSDAKLKGNWWELFQDPDLNPLVEKALVGNQNLRVAAARLEQARDQLTIARSGLFPAVDLSSTALRAKVSANRPLSEYSVPNQSIVQNDFRIGPSVTYEVDLFGRVRRDVEGARASAEQAEADFENTRLVLMATLVTDYYSLRENDAEIEVLRRSLDLERNALTFVTSRHDLGFATGLDLAQQEALLEASTTQLELLKVQRSQFEHAIATLVGIPAPSFSLAPVSYAPPLPAFPLGLPSDLLQRRPDVAAAERAMAAANARIGVARAAYYPSINLAPVLGVPDGRATRCRRCSRRPAGFGRSACPPRNCCLTLERRGLMSGSQTPITAPPLQRTAKPYWPPWRRWRTALPVWVRSIVPLYPPTPASAARSERSISPAIATKAAWIRISTSLPRSKFCSSISARQCRFKDNNLSPRCSW